jgi:hypothetical protein
MNILQMAEFYFFQGEARSNDTPATALEFKGLSEENIAQHVQYVRDVTRILLDINEHMWVGSSPTTSSDPNRPNVGAVDSLIHVRSRTLRGVVLCFSAVIPRDSDPRENQLWKDAEKFGAECRKELTPDVTHLVTSRTGSDKYREAKKRKLIIVSVEWLQQSILRWQRQDESLHPPPV